MPDVSICTIGAMLGPRLETGLKKKPTELP
jgi:hypothetical protein